MRHQTGAFESFTAGVLTLALLFASVAPPIVSGHASRTTQSHLTKSSVPNQLTQNNLRQTHAAQTYRKAPISFEANEGQADRSVKFLARGAGYQLHLTSTQAVLSLNKEAGEKHKQDVRSRQNSRRSSVGDVVRMTLLKARPDATVSGEDVLPGKVNYLLGNNRRSWRTNVATYGKVRYKDLYRGIDLVYYGNQRSLEYDFHLAPGANPEEIRLGIEGVKRTEIDSVTGDLIMRLSSGVIRQQKPVLYQEIDGLRRPVTGRFVFRGRNQIGFEVGAYDKSRALVIDPVLVYTTYFGGAGDEATNGIAVDSAGSVYVTGWFSSSPGFPVTPNAFQKTQNNSNGNGEAFITKFTPDGAGMVYSTLLGGNSTDTTTGIALDPAGNAYVVGWTDSADFPLRNAFQSTLRGSPNAFVTKLNTTGSDLLYSTFIGGSGNFDFATDIAVDPAGNAFITGDTGSINFPVTPGALRTTHVRLLSPVGEQDGFVAKFNTNATGEASLVFSTFFDINEPFSNSIAIDAVGNAYITGDARVQKLNASGSALVYSFIIPDATTPRNSRLHTTDIAVDGSGQAYVTGYETRFAGETSPNLKIVNGFQPTFGGGLIDGFLVKLNTAGTALLYSTYLGGTNIDVASAVAVDSTGHAYLAGDTASADFPTRDAFQTLKLAGNDLDLFITKIDTNVTGANSLVFSTYYGASNFDEAASGVAIDSEGNIYATGFTFRITIAGIIHTGRTAIPGDDSQSDPFILKIANTSSNVIRFGSERLSASEAAGSFQVTVVREGDSSAAANVDFATLDARAQRGSDYTSASGTLMFAPGETVKTFSVLITDDTAAEPNESLFVILRENVVGLALAAPTVAELTIIDNDATVQFSNTAFSVSEGAGFANLTVTRVGDTSRTATVLYSTADTAGSQSCTVVNNKASERCDYSTSVGRVQFEIGQTTQSIIIPIVDDALVEGNETFTVTLNGPAGALLGPTTTATITITDNDSSPAVQNPIDGVNFFVTQQYIDLLGRLPDPIGFADWTNTLGNCPNGGFGEFDNPHCDRVHVSSGFFLSEEFRVRGYFAYRFYEVGFDRRPTYAEFVPDMAQVGGSQSPASEAISKAVYTDAFVQRQEFKNRYDALSNTAYVDALETNAEVTLSNKAALVAALDSNQKSRAQVLREIVELQAVTDKFFIRAFVAMQYFGYLRRDPDPLGYDDWVATLTADPGNFRHLIFGFIYSTEYRQRFGRP